MNRCWMVLLIGFLTAAVWAEPVVVTVYSSPETVVSDAEGRELGRSGRPFRLEIEGEEVTLVLTADGYKSTSVSLTADELRTSQRVPAQGVLELEKDASSSLAVVAGVLVLGLGVGLWRRRKAGVGGATAADVFEKGELLGEGATALVYAATSSVAPGVSLAVKLLKPECAKDEAVRGRLFRSLESGKELEHPNLVKVYSWGETADGLPFLLLERLHGVTLEQYLRKNPRPTIDDVLNIMESLCSVLQHLHEKTVVHRDVKPENIFLTRDDRVKLMDLEISRSKDSEDLTKTGVVVGTPFYLAPEQIRGEVSPQSDQYSLGIILFEMLGGEKPFQGESSMDLINEHLSRPVPSLRALNPDLTPLQEAVVNKMLAKNPKQRFPDIQKAWEAMVEAFRGGADDATATSV